MEWIANLRPGFRERQVSLIQCMCMMNFRIDLKEEKKRNGKMNLYQEDCRYEDNSGNIIIGEENQEKLSLKTN